MPIKRPVPKLFPEAVSCGAEFVAALQAQGDETRVKLALIVWRVLRLMLLAVAVEVSKIAVDDAEIFSRSLRHEATVGTWLACRPDCRALRAFEQPTFL